MIFSSQMRANYFSNFANDFMHYIPLFLAYKPYCILEALKSGTYVYEESLKPIAPRSREIPPIIVQTIPYFSVNNFYR